jgi:hypothetical protein
MRIRFLTFAIALVAGSLLVFRSQQNPRDPITTCGFGGPCRPECPANEERGGKARGLEANSISEGLAAAKKHREKAANERFAAVMSRRT